MRNEQHLLSESLSMFTLSVITRRSAYNILYNAFHKPEYRITIKATHYEINIVLWFHSHFASFITLPKLCIRVIFRLWNANRLAHTYVYTNKVTKQSIAMLELFMQTAPIGYYSTFCNRMFSIFQLSAEHIQWYSSTRMLILYIYRKIRR